MRITEAIRKDVDLKERPSNYFWASDIGLHLPSHIKGQERRRLHAQALEQDEYLLPPDLSQHSLPHDLRMSWGRIHPRYMGGEYLPDRKNGEVEIARIAIDSTTGDVICVYARLTKTRIHYRVVDEYEGDTINGSGRRTSLRPLSLGQLLEFFIGAWDLRWCLEGNELLNDPEAKKALDFITDASSDFYEDFDLAIRSLVQHWCKEEAKLHAEPQEV